MDSIFMGMLLALWFGILTSISPCPLATNIAAISFIGKNIEESRNVFLSGLFYTLGRALAYLVIGILVVSSILSTPSLSQFLQNNISKILGPLLIIVGVFLLELIEFNIGASLPGEKMQEFAKKSGIWGAGILGILFALSFCPVSAALFFGSLIPLALKHGSKVVLPLLYGVGTALPVFVFAILISYGAKSIGKVFKKISTFEMWARKITGVIFILAGIYLSLSKNFGLF